MSPMAGSDGHCRGKRSRTTDPDNNTTGQSEEAQSEGDSSESAFGSDTETSSDSGSSSADSEDEEGDQHSANKASIPSSVAGHDMLDTGLNVISLSGLSRRGISPSSTISASSDLPSRIAAFLPQLRKANEDLVGAEADLRIDAVADDQDHYIEMDLGLGVLKERRRRRRRPANEEILTRQSSSSSSSSTGSSSTGDSDNSGSSSDHDADTKASGPEAMRTLLGKNAKGPRQGRPNIEVLEEK